MTYENAWYAIATTTAQVMASLSGIFLAVSSLRLQQLDVNFREKCSDLSAFFARIGLYDEFLKATNGGVFSKNQIQSHLNSIENIKNIAVEKSSFGSDQDWQRSPILMSQILSALRDIVKATNTLRARTYVCFLFSIIGAGIMVCVTPLGAVKADENISSLVAIALSLLFSSAFIMASMLTAVFNIRLKYD
jgi:hypothetical protein